jgi:hypothetical protein
MRGAALHGLQREHALGEFQHGRLPFGQVRCPPDRLLRSRQPGVQAKARDPPVEVLRERQVIAFPGEPRGVRVFHERDGQLMK